jgi:hypothetical protein
MVLVGGFIADGQSGFGCGSGGTTGDAKTPFREARVLLGTIA